LQMREDKENWALNYPGTCQYLCDAFGLRMGQNAKQQSRNFAGNEDEGAMWGTKWTQSWLWELKANRKGTETNHDERQMRKDEKRGKSDPDQSRSGEGDSQLWRDIHLIVSAYLIKPVLFP
jgi:hypothetical protein